MAPGQDMSKPAFRKTSKTDLFAVAGNISLEEQIDNMFGEALGDSMEVGRPRQ